MTFSTCVFITDQSIASYQEIFLSIPVEDKLATPALGYIFPCLQIQESIGDNHNVLIVTT